METWLLERGGAAGATAERRDGWQQPSMSFTQGDSLPPLTSLFFVEGWNEMNLQIGKIKLFFF